MRSVWSGVVAFGLVAGFASAQETEPEPEQRREPRPHIQVLKDPYELASFYRSSSGPRPSFYERWAPARDSALPPAWFRPDLRERSFRPHWDSDLRFFMDDGGERWRGRDDESGGRGRRDEGGARRARPRR